MTIAKLDGKGRVIVPAGVVALRNPSQLTLPVVAREHTQDLRQLVTDLQYLIDALQKAPQGKLNPVDLSRLNFDRAAFNKLLQGLNLDDSVQQLALANKKLEFPGLPIVLRNVLAADHDNGNNVTLLLQFIATLMQNQGPINLINTGAAIEAQNQSGQKVTVLPLAVLQALRPLTVDLKDEDALDLNIAVVNACAALADLTDNAVVAINYVPCTHLAQAIQANPMLPMALFAIPVPIIEALNALQPGQQQAVIQFTPELVATLQQQFGITADSPAERIAQLQHLANLVRTYARSKPQQEQLAALLAASGSSEQQALAAIPSLAGANQDSIEQRLWITATVLDALAAQEAHPEVPLSFFVIRNAQNQFDYGFGPANSTAAIMAQKGVLHAVSQKQIQSLTSEQAALIDSIGKMSKRQALTQPTSTGQPQQPAPQVGQQGWGAWLYNTLPTKQRVLTEFLRALK